MFDLTNAETFVVDRDGIVLDELIWRRYHRKTPGLVEATLTLNPGLADLGPLLPRGTRGLIPIDRPGVSQLPVQRLW